MAQAIHSVSAAFLRHTAEPRVLVGASGLAILVTVRILASAISGQPL